MVKIEENAVKNALCLTLSLYSIHSSPLRSLLAKQIGKLRQIIESSGSRSVVIRQVVVVAAAAAPKNLSEIQVLGPQPRATES